ncbi:MAG: FAD-dependent oxidoreductase, partial [Opitutales bacterium]
LGQAWGMPLLREGRILRFPENEEELTRFRRRKTDPAFESFLGDEFPPGHWSGNGWIDELGSYQINGVGWAEVGKIAATIRERYREKGILRDECFEHKDLEVGGTGCKWRGVEAESVVFCEGARVVANPWFQDLPFAPSRGETLDLAAKEMPVDEILQSGFWLLPSPDGSLRAGSTYDHEDLASGPTKTGREQILDGLARFLSVTPPVVGQRCGLRPGTRDRLPVMGRNSERPRIALFNGFGSKGASWVPLLAETFADHLLDGSPLDPEVDLLRFPKDNA